MSSLVLELQAGALNSSVSVLDLLRKALVVAKKLGVEDFQKWIELELDGYKQIPIPEYRLIRGQAKRVEPISRMGTNTNSRSTNQKFL